MSTELGKRLFTFAVVTDTHVNFGETECNSEFEINKRANGRLRHVVRDLNRRDLAFVMHLGDVVHPVPALADLYEQAAARFREIAAELHHPLYLAPGNHDIGDKPIVWGPGGVVREEFIELWNRNFGPNYQAFEHGDCRFYLVDAQIINSGLALEAEQKAWLEADLAEAADAGKRLFLGTHYPPFLTEAGEDEHFDNIAEPGRSWLLNLLERHGAEALFSGHVHNFWYNRHGVTDCYALPSTAFVRQDYAEIFRASPPPENGGRAQRLRQARVFPGACPRGRPPVPLGQVPWCGRRARRPRPRWKRCHRRSPSAREPQYPFRARHAPELAGDRRGAAVGVPGRVRPQTHAQRLCPHGPPGHGGAASAHPGPGSIRSGSPSSPR